MSSNKKVNKNDKKSNDKNEKKINEKKEIDVTEILINKEIKNKIDKIIIDKNIEIVSPYRSHELKSIIVLEPKYMNNDLYYNLKMKLLDKVGKCNNIGYIVDIEKILDYSNGELKAEDFTCSCYYEIKYQAIMCIPIVNTIIVGIITKKVNRAVYMIVQHGPINIICQLVEKYINMSNFKLENNELYNINIKRNIVEGDYVKIKIKTLNLKYDTISCIGILEDIATENEINKYYENIEINKKDKEEKIINNNIEYNDDDMVNENNINKADIKINTNYVDI